MTKLLKFSLVLLIALTHQTAQARIAGRQKIIYPLLERSKPQQQQQTHRNVQQQTMKLTMSQLEQLKLLSYSDDSAPKQLDAFYLGLYETDGELPSASLTTVMDGVNAFVYTELNAVYDAKRNAVHAVQTKIMSQATAASSRYRRSVQVTTGTNLETQLNVIFANEPSPDASDVTSKVHAIFEDTDKLQYLLTNITSRRASDDTALSRVNAILFWKDVGAVPMPDDSNAPTLAPNGGVTDGSVTDIEDPNVPVEPDNYRSMPSRKVLPIVVSATLVLVLVALFANHRRRQATAQRNPAALVASNQLSTAELTGGDGTVNLFWESDDIFSVEAALVETSNNTSKSYLTANHSSSAATPSTITKDFLSDDLSTQPTVTAANRSAHKVATTDDQSDIFSGVMSGFLDNFSNLSSPRYMSGTGLDSLESPQGVESSPMNGNVGDSRSVFSFLSGFASKASTVVASNVTPQTQQQQMSNKVTATRNVTTASPVVTDSGVSVAMNPLSPSEGNGRMGGGTPHSRVSSLFTFSEEDSEDLVSSSDERSKEPNKPTDLLMRVPSDEEDEDNESLTALVKTAVNVEVDSEKSEAAPSIVNGTSIVVTTAEPEFPDSTRSQQDDLNGVDKYSTAFEDQMSPLAVDPTLVLSKGTSTESKHNDCCKDAYASVFKSVPDSQEAHPSSSVVNEALTDFTLVANDTLSNQDGFTRLSAEEITKELAEAEQESNRLKKLSTHWTMSMFSSPTAVESPAAATYNGTRALDLASPSSLVSNKSEPSHNAKMIQLQWDDPSQSALNRAKAAAFAESVTGNTLSTGKDSASERFTMFTGRKSNTQRNILNRSFERMSTKSAGHADGTNIYQTIAAEEGSVGSGESSPRRHGADQTKPVVDTPGIESTVSMERTRVHAKNMAGDGTTNYQHETMGEWSVAGDNDDPSLSDSDSAGKGNNATKSMSEIILGSAKGKVPSMNDSFVNHDTPRSAATNTSAISGLSVDTPILNADASPSKQLISDLLWLENKIAATNKAILSSPRHQGKTEEHNTAKNVNPLIEPSDSLSFSSNDGLVPTSPADEPNSSNEASMIDRNAASKDDSMSVHQSIVCRDCFAPPGKLKIVIHSTKDGPAVHTVKKGSSLEGHIFAGDLIISVDNVDTRTFSAEQVMKMMTAKTRFERKITVLHFEKEPSL